MNRATCLTFLWKKKSQEQKKPRDPATGFPESGKCFSDYPSGYKSKNMTGRIFPVKEKSRAKETA
jgi:hypothetical protein